MKRSLLLLLAAFAIGTVALHAQDSERGPDGGTSFHVSGVEILPVQNRPFSGTDHIIWTRTLEDGSVIKTHLDADLARDSQGRIYRETRSFVSEGSGLASRLTSFSIYDPERHTRTSCVMATHRCTVSPHFMPTSFTEKPIGPFDDGTRYLRREPLGTNTLDGLDVTGTRETTTINAGVIGNDHSLKETREFWYSPDLQVNLAITRSDPRNGVQQIQINNLSRSEPPPERFQIPAGFTAEDTRHSQQANR